MFPRDEIRPATSAAAEQAADAELPPLPEAFVDRLTKLVPPAWLPSCLASFSAVKPAALRINRLKARDAEVLAELRREGIEPAVVDWLDGAYLVEADRREQLTRGAAAAEGRIYLQGLSSMAAPWVLGPRPGEEVLDLAAAPGGKTLQMAAMMEGRGRIAAVEPIRTRMFRLQANLRRAGATIVATYLTDGRTVGRKTPERFDRVLLDAPCSGEARFSRRRPDRWHRWSERKIREAARKQKGLLLSAALALRPGGRLLYCTCSLAPEENEAVIDFACRRLGDVLQILPIELPIPGAQPGILGWDDRQFLPEVSRAVRILPQPSLDAFFLCLLEKRRSMRPSPESHAARRGHRRRGDRGNDWRSRRRRARSQ